MNKPILLARADFIESLANLINTSGLPCYVMEPIIKDALNDVRQIMKQQFYEEKKAYEGAPEE